MIFFVNETHQDFTLELTIGENNTPGALKLVRVTNVVEEKVVSKMNLMYVSEENSDMTLEMFTGRMENGNVTIPKKHTTKLCPVGNKMVVVYTPGNGLPYDNSDSIADTVGCIQKHTPVEYNDARSLVIVLTEDRLGYDMPSITVHTDESSDSPVTKYSNHVWDKFNITKFFIREAKWQKLQSYNIVIGNLPNGDRLDISTIFIVKDQKKSIVNALIRYDRNGERVMDKIAAKKSGHCTENNSAKKSTKKPTGKKPYKPKNNGQQAKGSKPKESCGKKPYNSKSKDGDKRPYPKSSENNKHNSEHRPSNGAISNKKSNGQPNERSYQKSNTNKKNAPRTSALEKNKRKFS